MKSNKIIVFLTFVIFGISTYSCSNFDEGAVPFNPENKNYRREMSSCLVNQFTYIWSGINTSYVFWEEDSTDWDNVYRTYAPKFKELDEKGKSGENIPNDSIENLMLSFTSTLRDHHMEVKMTNPYNNGSVISVMPGQEEVMARGTGDDSWTSLRLFRKLGTSRVYKSYPITDYYDEEAAETCLLFDNIPYLHLSKYKLDEDEGSKSIVTHFLNNIQNLSTQGSLKGIIIDNRGNSGGNKNNIDFFLKTFSDHSVEVLHERTKTGLGRYDYTPWYSFSVAPDPSQYISTKDVPIVVLQNTFTASTAEILSYALSFLPNVHTVGERTFGATGPYFIYAPNCFYAGPFNYDNFANDKKEFGNSMAVLTSNFSTRFKNKKTGAYECYEGIGFMPDEVVNIDSDLYYQSENPRDNQLDAALKHIGIKLEN